MNSSTALALREVLWHTQELLAAFDAEETQAVLRFQARRQALLAKTAEQVARLIRDGQAVPSCDRVSGVQEEAIRV